MVANGPNVRPGRIHGNLTDVSPTVLALLGVPIPAGLDGKPLDVLQGVEATVDAEAASWLPSGVEAATGYTEGEEEAVRQRLEDLGYL